MLRNVEIKARVTDRETTRAAIERISEGECKVIHQRDVFFHAASGRLKLRVIDNDRAELIHYVRPDIREAKTSSYSIVELLSPNETCCLLSESLGCWALWKRLDASTELGKRGYIWTQ